MASNMCMLPISVILHEKWDGTQTISPVINSDRPGHSR